MVNPVIFIVFITLVIPGFLALQVFKAMIAEVKDKNSFLDVTYNSVIHSLFIFLCLYPFVKFFNINVFDEKSLISFVIADFWHPFYIVLTVLLFSAFYGSFYAYVHRKKWLKKILTYPFSKPGQ